MSQSTSQRRRLAGMIRQYAMRQKCPHNLAWHQFKAAYGCRYHTDLDRAMDRYEAREHRHVNLPAYLEATNNLDKALTVAGRMLKGR